MELLYAGVTTEMATLNTMVVHLDSHGTIIAVMLGI